MEKENIGENNKVCRVVEGKSPDAGFYARYHCDTYIRIFVGNSSRTEFSAVKAVKNWGIHFHSKTRSLFQNQEGVLEDFPFSFVEDFF